MGSLLSEDSEALISVESSKSPSLFMDNMETSRDSSDPWFRKKKKKKSKQKGQVSLQVYGDESDERQERVSLSSQQGSIRAFSRTRSLTDDDLDELKGCLDLGFGFSFDEIPELCNTLPALQLCYSMSHSRSPDSSPAAAAASDASPPAATFSPIANWRISSPGDHPEDVKARLKFWAQAVAFTVRLCS